MTARLSIVLALSALLLTCGYAPVRYADALGDARTIAIRGLRNTTSEPGLDALVSDALAREFLRRGALALVEEPERADLVLGGSVASLRVTRKSFSSISFALEYELALELDVELTRRDGTRVPLDRSALRETERYVASADVEVERTHREEALRRLASLLAGRIHDALFERLAP